MSETKRLNVKSTVKNSGLYIGHHLCTAKLESGEEVDMIGGPYDLIVQVYGSDKSVLISYEDIIREVLKVA